MPLFKLHNMASVSSQRALRSLHSGLFNFFGDMLCPSGITTGKHQISAGNKLPLEFGTLLLSPFLDWL